MKKTLIVLVVMASSAFVWGADNEKQEAKDANKATDRIQAAANVLHEIDHVGGARRFEEHVRLPTGLRLGTDGRCKCAPRAGLPVARDLPGARRIVELEDARLVQRTERAAARRVQRVAFRFRGPAFVRLDQHADAVAAQSHRRGVPTGHRRRDVRRLIDEQVRR